MARKFFTGAIFSDEVQVIAGNNYVKISEGSSIGQIELKILHLYSYKDGALIL